MNPSELTVGFRIANWHSPLRVRGSRQEGRYHRAGEIVQYFSLHPLGAFAEYVRRERPDPSMLGEFRHRLWAARVPAAISTVIDWHSADSHGITPEELVGDDYGPCQALADRLRDDGIREIVVPSAALPGTRNFVMFGERAPAPFTTPALDAVDVPATIAAEDATIPPWLLLMARMPGDDHGELEAWRREEPFTLVEPDTAPT